MNPVEWLDLQEESERKDRLIRAADAARAAGVDVTTVLSESLKGYAWLKKNDWNRLLVANGAYDEIDTMILALTNAVKRVSGAS